MFVLIDFLVLREEKESESKERADTIEEKEKITGEEEERDISERVALRRKWEKVEHKKEKQMGKNDWRSLEEGEENKCLGKEKSDYVLYEENEKIIADIFENIDKLDDMIPAKKTKSNNSKKSTRYDHFPESIQQDSPNSSSD